MQNNESRKRRKAVALRYDFPEDQAPVVVAKGLGKIAETILTLAQQHNIPIAEDGMLVEELLQLELNCDIPEALYEAVAEILAYIFQQHRQYEQKAT
ncbi:MAG: EscU/YscU/HrcU family type III secretion system export apparatus switch protein [candidate division KSB1 bacterium]|nr:EscU/YscU/HrcU family type III secretion system export apparatus switch protein [candidate division KSB1 bacterium]MDQ7062654.1 EscU/YscU/HrcU family type III secretion system export apparatus switch protein [candidate division KSB1 bacterium]